MTIVGFATALGITAGVGARYGWANAIVGAVVLGFTVLAVRIAKEAPRIYRTNGGFLCDRKARQAADALISIAAALAKSETARDVALEASSTLDESAHEGRSASWIITTALWLILRFPTAIKTRRTSTVPAPAAADPETEAPANEALGGPGFIFYRAYLGLKDYLDVRKTLRRTDAIFDQFKGIADSIPPARIGLSDSDLKEIRKVLREGGFFERHEHPPEEDA